MAFGGTNKYPDYGATNTPSTWSKNTKISNFTLYHQLCDNISCNIFSINNHVSGLEKAASEIGSATDSLLLRDKIHRTQQSANELIDSTTRFLKELNEIVQRGSKAEKEPRVQSERLRNEFQATIQRYSTLQRQLGPKMKRTMVTQPNRLEISTAGWNVEEDEKQSLIDSERSQKQMQLQEELEFEQEMLLERERRIREIESDMIDVNQIFRDLATLVHEQGDTLGTIEENVSTAAANAEEATTQLVKASQYQSKYRKKLCWLIVILLIVVVAIVIIVVPIVNK